MRIAAKLAALRLGYDTQRQRIKSLADPILANSDTQMLTFHGRAAFARQSIN